MHIIPPKSFFFSSVRNIFNITGRFTSLNIIEHFPTHLKKTNKYVFQSYTFHSILLSTFAVLVSIVFLFLMFCHFILPARRTSNFGQILCVTDFLHTASDFLRKRGWIFDTSNLYIFLHHSGLVLNWNRLKNIFLQIALSAVTRVFYLYLHRHTHKNTFCFKKCLEQSFLKRFLCMTEEILCSGKPNVLWILTRSALNTFLQILNTLIWVS